MTTPSSPAPAAAVVGVLGGRRGAHLIEGAADALGVEVRVLPTPCEPAGPARSDGPGRGGPDITDVLAAAEGCDVVTVDLDGVAPEVPVALAGAGHRVHPGPGTARVTGDRAVARRALATAGFPVPASVEVAAGEVDAVAAFAGEHGWPVVLRAPTDGDDGLGLEVLADLDALRLSPLAAMEPRWLVEAHRPVQAELIVAVARRPSGWWLAYPVVEVVDRRGPCRELVTPACVRPEVADRATRLAVSLADGVGAAGVLAVGLHLTTSGGLVVDHVSAGPHTPAHPAGTASTTSHPENHLRGVLDWPLGETDGLAPSAAAVDVLAPPHAVDLRRTVPEALTVAGVGVHLDRGRPGPDDRLGHVTCRADDTGTALAGARRARAALRGDRRPLPPAGRVRRADRSPP